MKIISLFFFALILFSCTKREKHVDSIKVDADSALTVENFKKEQAKNKKVEHDFNDNQYDAR